MSTNLSVVERQVEVGGGVLVAVVVADVQVLLVADVVDGQQANPVDLRAGRGLGVKVRVVQEHADVLKQVGTWVDG